MLSYAFSNYLLKNYQGIDNQIAKILSDNIQPRYPRYHVIAFDIPKQLFIFVGGGQKSIKIFLDNHKPTVTCNWIISKQIA